MVNSTPQEATQAATRQKLLWAAFWFVFISTPAALISMLVLLEHFRRQDVLKDYGLIECGSALFGGSIMAAFLLTRIQSKTTAGLVKRTLGLSLAFIFLFGALSYAGCMLIR